MRIYISQLYKHSLVFSLNLTIPLNSTNLTSYKYCLSYELYRACIVFGSSHLAKGENNKWRIGGYARIELFRLP